MLIVEGRYEMQYNGPKGPETLRVSLGKGVYNGKTGSLFFRGTYRDEGGVIIGDLAVTNLAMAPFGIEGKAVLLQGVVEADGRIKFYERGKAPAPDQTLVLLTPV